MPSQQINSNAQLTPPPDLLTQVQHYSLSQEVRGRAGVRAGGSQLVPVPHRQILARARKSWHRLPPHSPTVTQSGCIFGMKRAGSQGATGDYFNRMSTIPSRSVVSSGKVILASAKPVTKQRRRGAR